MSYYGGDYNLVAGVSQAPDRPCHYCGRTKLKPTASTSSQTDSQGEFSFQRFLGPEAELTDVEFVVKWQQSAVIRSFKAHRLILALQNEVFKAMFYGDFLKEEKVVITDLHPDGFHGLLRYFYTGRFEANSISDAYYTRTAAAKYLVTDLVTRCTTYIEGNLKPEDVCSYLDHILSSGESDADARAKVLLRTQGVSVLNSRAFISCSAQTVNYILDNVWNVAENGLVSIVYRWATTQCVGKGVVGDRLPEMVGECMRPLLPKLRFLALTADEFVRGPNTWRIMTDAEALAILGNIVAKGSMPLPAGFCDVRTQRVGGDAERTTPKGITQSSKQNVFRGW